jgi:hypothetical protein
MPDDINWQSANDFIEKQTRDIEREFKTSRPKPRNRHMGFKGEKRPKNPWFEDDGARIWHF